MQTAIRTSTPTHCPYCALQCGMNLVNSGETISVESRPDFPTNKGGMCQKGWTSAELLSHPERLTSPLVRDRKGSPLRKASWDEALDKVASGFLELKRAFGSDSVGVFGGGGLTNEKAYSLGKFARVALQTSQIDYNGRFCMSSASAANLKAFGVDRGLPFPLEDIPRANAILLVGSNLAETMPPIMQYFDEQRRNGGDLIVVDPRQTVTAQSATLFLQLTPGTDAALANGILNIAITEGLVDWDFIETRTIGFDEVRRSVGAYWPDRVERITGVPVRKLTQAAHILGEAGSAMVLTARGPEQQSSGVNNVLAYINIALALGHAGKPHCGYGCITGQGNGQGGREHGQKADQLPGYRKIDNQEHREYIASVWGVPASHLPGPGRSAYELLDALGTTDGPKALLVMGSNPVVSAPKAAHIQKRLESLELLVVSDFVLSDTAEIADVVLPTTQWAEEDGTMTNLEGRVLLRRRAANPYEGARSDLDILADLGELLGYKSFFARKPRDVFEELRRASAGGVADYSGITYERISAENGVFWPCPSIDHPGTPRMFLDKFATPDGRAKFHAINHMSAVEEPDAEFPLFLTTGRIMAQYQSGSQTRRIAALLNTSPSAFVEIHPELASMLGIEDGEVVCVRTRRGTIEVKAKITDTIRRDTIFVPFHWAKQQRANVLTNPALDPVSKMPEFKICAACVCKIIPTTPSECVTQ